MAKSLRILLFLLVFIVIFGSHHESLGKSFVSPKGAVNDFANIIPDEYKTKMERLANEVLLKTGTSIVVATFETIMDDDINDFANRLYEAWGIGKKGEDKGVLIFLALKERKIRIETGYGTEPILPDGLVGEILDTYAVPYLKRGEYGIGLYVTMLKVASFLAREKGASLSENVEKRRRVPLPLLFLIVMIFILFFFPFSHRSVYRRRSFPFVFLGGPIYRGGIFGPFGGGFGGFGGGLSGGGGATREF